MTCIPRSSATDDSGTIAISDNSTLGASSALTFARLTGVKLPCLTGWKLPAFARDRWPHLRRQDGFGRVPIDGRWAMRMRAFAAARSALRVAARWRQSLHMDRRVPPALPERLWKPRRVQCWAKDLPRPTTKRIERLLGRCT